MTIVQLARLISSREKGVGPLLALASGDVMVANASMNNFQAALAGGTEQTAIFTWMGNGSSVITDYPLVIIGGPESGIRTGHPEDLDGHRNLVLTMAMDLSAARGEALKLPVELDEFYL